MFETINLQIKQLQEFTDLPLTLVYIADQSLPSLIVTTPHKGEVEIKLKKEHYPFIFGSVTQTDLSVKEILDQLDELEMEAIDIWFKEWHKTLPSQKKKEN